MAKNKENINIKIGIALSYLGIAINLISNIVFQRFINSPDNVLISQQYDFYSFSSSISSLLIILTLGISSSYIRFATKAEKEDKTNGLKKINSVYLIFLFVSSILALFIGTLIGGLFLSGIIPLKNYSSDQITLVSIFLFLGAVNVALGFIASIFTVFLNYKTKFILVRSLTLIFSTASPLISIPFIKNSNSLVVFSIVHIVLTLISLVIQVIYSVFVLRYRASFKINKDFFGTFKEIFVFTLYIFLVEIFVQFDANSDKILLGFFAPSNGDEANVTSVGNYNIAFSIVSVVGTSCSAVFSSYAPRINRAVINNDKNEVNNIFNRTTEIAILIYFFIFGGFVCVGREFINIWLGDKRSIVYYLVVFLLLIYLIPYTINIASEIQRAYNKHKFRSICMLVMAIFNISFSFLSLFLISINFSTSDKNYLNYQLFSVLFVTFVSNIVFNGIIMMIYNRKYLDIDIKTYFTKILMYLIVFIVSVFSTLFIYSFNSLNGLDDIYKMLITGSTYVIIFSMIMIVFNRRFIVSLFKNKEEVKKIELNSNDLKAIKKIELNILKDIVRVCDLLNINYFCVGGTALGAFKYKGFIPWDDDIDIAMKRCDFEKFIKEAPNLLDSNLFVQSFETDNKFISTIAKVRDKRTTFSEISTKNMNICGGVFVDIFPIDNSFNSKNKLLLYKLNYAKINSYFDKIIDYSSPKTFLIDFLNIFQTNKVSKLMEKNIKILKGNKGYDSFCRGINYSRDVFSNYTYLEFENLKVKVPIEIEKYLSLSYDDIKKDPPIEDRVSHHYIYEFDVNKVDNI